MYDMKITFDVKNLESKVKREIHGAMKEVALKGEEVAKENAPVDTGHLRRSISSDSDMLSARVYTNIEYAPYVEFGTSRQPSQPFMLPAFQAMVELTEQRVREAVERGLS